MKKEKTEFSKRRYKITYEDGTEFSEPRHNINYEDGTDSFRNVGTKLPMKMEQTVFRNVGI